MAFKRVQTVEIWSILRRWSDKQSISTIAASVDCDRKTVRAYIEMARRIGITKEEILPERKEELLPRLQEAAERMHCKATSRLLLEPFVDEILSLINNRENPLKPKTAFEVILIRYDLRGKVSYSSFKRLARARQLVPDRKRATCRIETPPAQQIQLDYGKMGLHWDPLEKRRRTLYAFIGTLSFSRHKFVQFVYSQNQQSFTQSHVDMFTWFGGVTRILTMDNLKDGVLKPDIYDPIINRSYADLAEFYKTFIDPCRIASPQDKGKVERDVPTVREFFRKTITLYPSASIGELNSYAREWLVKEYGLRPHGSTGEAPYALFTNYERPVLSPLPVDPFTVALWKQAVVHPDHFIQVDGYRFNLSTEYIGKTVQVMITPKQAKIFYQDQLIKTRTLTNEKVYIDWEDFPSTVEFALSEETPRRLIRKARETGGQAFEELVIGLLSVPGFSYLRRAIGLRELVKGYRFEVVEAAATVALTLGKPVTTHLFKHMLETVRKAEDEAVLLEGLPLSEQTESFMRSADYFLQEGARASG
jgi:transposase